MIHNYRFIGNKVPESTVTTYNFHNCSEGKGPTWKKNRKFPFSWGTFIRKNDNRGNLFCESFFSLVKSDFFQLIGLKSLLYTSKVLD